MRIAVFHELPKGGAENAVQQMALRLKKKHTVDLFTTNPHAPKDKISFTHIHRYAFSPKKWTGRNWKRKLYKDTFELLKLIILHRKIARDIDKNVYDLVFVHASQYIETPFILRFLRTKSFFYCHDPHDRLVYDKVNTIPSYLPWYKKKYENTMRRVRKFLDKKNFEKINFIIANSEYTKKIIRKTYNKQSKVIYLGVDTKIFKPLYGEKSYDILFVGSTQELDGFDLYVDILKRIPLRIKTRSVLAELEWIDSVEEMASIYSQSKLLIALAKREPFGLVPLEAMACGTPVAVVDEAGYKETVIHGKNGFLLKRDARLFSKTITEILKDKRKLSEMGVFARDYATKKWSWENTIVQLESFFNNN